MDTSSQFGQARRAAVRKAPPGRARLAGANTSPQSYPDPSVDRWAKRLVAAGRNLTETYTDAIASGIEPEELDFALIRLADAIARAQARQEYSGQHRRNANQDDRPRLVIPDAPGADCCPDPRAIETPAKFVDALREYRLWAGNPSLRRMQSQCGNRFAASTLCTALRGSELPSLAMTDAIIVGCGGREEDRKAFATAWRRLAFSQHHADQQARGPATVRSLYPVS
jgi:hypothetical protein